jgi:CBS-domain-containing membrane protein
MFAELHVDTQRLMNTLHFSARHPAPSKVLRPVSAPRAVTPASAAVEVMTDFAHEHPVTVGESRGIDDALEDMIRFGVRALLVVKGEQVTGLITSYDIQGERPLKFLLSSTHSRHDEILVGHIMTPWVQVPVLDWEEVRDARVRDVVEIFRAAEATHFVVLEADSAGSPRVRGLISRARLERQLAAAAS